MSEASPAAQDILQRIINTVDQDDAETLETLRHICKTKPYSVIMIIALYIWPRQRREQVARDLAELKSISNDASDVVAIERSEFTALLWDNLNVKPYYQYINRHKAYVTVGFHTFNDFVIHSVKNRLSLECLLLEEYLPLEDPSGEQIKKHDDSKYSFVETVTYAMKFYPNDCLGEPDNDAFSAGVDHHYCHNEHHPEHWGDRPMPWRYIVEAMYDMAAMELERRFGGHTPDNRAELLVFKPQYLQRFNRTKQLDFVKKLIRYTKESYCEATRQKLPAEPAAEALPAEPAAKALPAEAAANSSANLASEPAPTP